MNGTKGQLSNETGQLHGAQERIRELEGKLENARNNQNGVAKEMRNLKNKVFGSKMRKLL